jgi:hypothetical protein
MTDRELLELAAKAAGLGPLMSEPYSLGGTRYFYREDDYPSGTTWNPLTDDGDALRLAVKLDLLMDVCTVSGGIRAAQVLWSVCGPSRITEEHRTDPYAATRRAITRAAATLAKGEGKV